MDSPELERNKEVVLRFNHEVIEQGNEAALGEILAEDFINHSAAPGTSKGPDGMGRLLIHVLRPAFPDLRVEIHQQVAEGDMVATHKTVHGTHLGELMGIPATGTRVAISVMDFVRIRDGKYVEHWGNNNLSSVIGKLRAATPPSP